MAPWPLLEPKRKGDFRGVIRIFVYPFGNKTMKKTLKFSLILSGLLLLASSAFAQTLLTTTTLSTAIPTTQAGKSTFVTLASISGVAVNGFLYVDGELMSVTSVPATGTTVGVVRGYGGGGYSSSGGATPHLSGALVFVIPVAASGSALVTVDPAGACARGSASYTNGAYNVQSTLYLPIINTATGSTFDCLGGVFVKGSGGLPPFHVLAPNSGGTAYTSLNSSGTTLVAGTFYCSEIDVPYNKLVTGIGVLNGTTVGTDNHLVALFDSAGNLITNSAVAGVVAASASTYQNIAFTSTYYLIGPATYFGCVQSNGTTATVRMMVTGTQDTYWTTSKTGAFGTIPATITAPSTFTTAVGPYLYLY
jgi:hypothetical protein